MGVVDPANLGIIGHSWGGFDTAFLATHTELFKAAVAGAPITDLVSNYGNHHWSSGIAETDHIETGQQRMQVPLYEDLPGVHPQFGDLHRAHHDRRRCCWKRATTTAPSTGTRASRSTTSRGAREGTS